MDRQRKSARGWRLNSGKRTDGENFVAFRKILTRVSLENLFLAEFGRFDDSFVRKMASLKKMVIGKYKRGKITKSCMHVNGGEAMT